MNYDVCKKLYHIEFVAETKGGEVFAGSVALTSARQIDKQVKHYFPEVARLQSYTCDTVMCSMPVSEYFETATKTRIGE